MVIDGGDPHNGLILVLCSPYTCFVYEHIAVEMLRLFHMQAWRINSLSILAGSDSDESRETLDCSDAVVTPVCL
jgi:hypothetical protein